MFVDRATVVVTAGSGGSGCAAFRRERGIPRGGPSGGDGGKGGDVIMQVDAHMHTLLDFKRRPHLKAGRGMHGEGSNKTGAGGEDIIIRVPPGTVIIDTRSGEVLADLTEPDAVATVALGGRGGRGNARFVSSVNQAPRQWEAGAEGEKRTLTLELKLIADVGLVGHPNAGKSTLLSRLSAARPKIADYPFTTLEPNLGLIKLGNWGSCVMADIPGLIEGASEGKGLGIEFLRHIERTSVLFFMVDLLEDDPLADLAALKRELAAYSPELLERPSTLLLTKLDTIPPDERVLHLELRGLPPGSLPGEVGADTLPDVSGMRCLAISSHSGEGLERVSGILEEMLREVDGT